jgi:ABC-type transport system substrate-binding protein
MSAPFQNILARALTAFVFVGSLGLFTLLLSGDLTAQQAQGKKSKVVEEEEDDKQPKKKPPVVEEEEDTSAKQKKKVIRVDDDDAPRTNPRRSGGGDGISGDLTALKDKSKNTGLKELGRKLFHPHDVINAEYTGGRKARLSVEPLAKNYGPTPKLSGPLPVVSLTDSFAKDAQFSLAPEVIKHYTPYEEQAQLDVESFLKERPWDELPMGSNDYLSKRDQFAYAAHVLSEVEKWHRFARDKAIRQENWGDTQNDLQKKIVHYREQQLDQVLNDNDWDAAVDLARDIGRSDPAKPTQERLAKKLAEYMVKVVGAGGVLTAEQLTDLRNRLKQLERDFPGSSALIAIGGDLKIQAEKLFARAKAAFKAGQNQEAIQLLQTALDLYPQLPELQDYFLQRKNEYPTLKVGVRSVPEYMAPGIAWTESERQVVEMIFENLVSQVPVSQAPDGTGDDVAETYRPALAESMPQQTAQLERLFRISRDAVWAKPNETAGITAADVRRTYQFLTQENSRFFNPAWKELVNNVLPGVDNRQVNISLKHGFVDPYAAMTFKILPDEAGGKDFKEGFAKKPFGSGPYMFDGPKSIDNENRLVFKANRFYGARPGKLNMPRIREVYMSEVNPTTAVDDFRKGRFDVLLPEVVRSMGPGGVDALRNAGIKVVGPLPTRRIYFLAINLRKPVFESQELRVALAHAIVRADILKNVFGGLPGDKTLRGPFPTGSWAWDPKDNKELDNPAIAKVVINQGAAKQKLKEANVLSLRFPQGDKQIEAAMEAIAKQLDDTLGVKVQLQPTNEHDLREKVEKTYAYDLAYYHYDFPSEAYWLWPLFHPSGWYFPANMDAPLEAMFRQAMARRDPAELQQQTHTIHSWLKDKMYMIPLWQIGSYVALREDIETPTLDPLRVLAEVGKWRRKARQSGD